MERITYIQKADQTAMKKSQHIWDHIAKPLHSLGLLEDSITRIAGMTGNPDVRLDKRCVIVMCSDHGVVAEGVTQTDSSVTMRVAESMAKGHANISLMAKTFGAAVRVVDIGMKSDSTLPEIISDKIAYGTFNMAHRHVMTCDQAKKSIAAGISQVSACKKEGCQIIVTGEMGIGNTTPASAIASVLLNEAPEKVTGKGAGLSRAGIEKKISVIQHAINQYQPDPEDAIDMISKIGGFDIAGMTGVFLGGAVYQVPVVIDGLISAVAAALAVKINPLAKDYMLPSHVSKEPAGQKMLDYLGLKPLITAELCLGEGTGGILLLPLLDGALAVYHGSHHFEDLNMASYTQQ